MKKTAAIVILWLVLAIPGALAMVLFLLRALFLDASRIKEELRSFDQVTNACWFGGNARETLSSASWRQQRKWIIWLTDRFEQDHCRKANAAEQPVVDFINERDKG